MVLLCVAWRLGFSTKEINDPGSWEHNCQCPAPSLLTWPPISYLLFWSLLAQQVLTGSGPRIWMMICQGNEKCQHRAVWMLRPPRNQKPIVNSVQLQRVSTSAIQWDSAKLCSENQLQKFTLLLGLCWLWGCMSYIKSLLPLCWRWIRQWLRILQERQIMGEGLKSSAKANLSLCVPTLHIQLAASFQWC